MKKTNLAALFTFIITLIIPCTIYANSSWVWISKTRPYDILPFVVIGTLLIETLSIHYFGKSKGLLKTFLIITAANSISFAMPYLIEYSGVTSPYGKGTYIFEHAPVYTVGIVYFIMTIACELPIVYSFLKKNTENRKALLISIITSNLVTTVLVAIIERTICVGRW